MTNKQALTVWKDGSYKVWGGMDAEYAKSDADYLVSIGLGEIEELAAKDTQSETSGEFTNPAPVAS